MSNNIENLKNLLTNLDNSKSTGRATTPENPSLKPGEIYEVETSNEDFNHVIILEKHSENSVSVAPFSSTPEYAGPEDLMLPYDSWGGEAAVFFECEFNINTKNLGRCISSLADEDINYIERARQANEKDEGKNLFNWGQEYIDKYDLSYIHHDQILQSIEALQKAPTQTKNNIVDAYRNNDTAQVFNLIKDGADPEELKNIEGGRKFLLMNAKKIIELSPKENSKKAPEINK